ncbi:MAG: hypothetical protein COB67_09890, partial [SAR324 cluster bacterium]
MEWYWQWVIFLGIAGISFYLLFYLTPQLWTRFRPQKKEGEEELILPTEQEEPTKHCPICNRAMSKDSLNGVIVDRCAPHGIWFD